MMLIDFTTDDGVNLPVKVLSARVFYCKVTIFLCVLCEEYRVYVDVLFDIKLSLAGFSTQTGKLEWQLSTR